MLCDSQRLGRVRTRNKSDTSHLDEGGQRVGLRRLEGGNALQHSGESHEQLSPANLGLLLTAPAPATFFSASDHLSRRRRCPRRRRRLGSHGDGPVHRGGFGVLPSVLHRHGRGAARRRLVPGGVPVRPLLGCAKGSGATPHARPGPPPPARQVRPRRLRHPRQAVWPYLQVSHGEAAAGDRGGPGAVQGGGHKKVQEPGEQEPPFPHLRVAPPPEGSLLHQRLEMVGHEEHHHFPLPARPPRQPHPHHAILDRLRLPPPLLSRPRRVPHLLRPLPQARQRRHRTGRLRRRLRPLQTRRRRREARGGQQY